MTNLKNITQHLGIWLLPANPNGGYKKAHDTWKISQVYNWQPKTYIGRVQVISVFDNVNKFDFEKISPAVEFINNFSVD